MVILYGSLDTAAADTRDPVSAVDESKAFISHGFFVDRRLKQTIVRAKRTPIWEPDKKQPGKKALGSR